MFIPTFLFKSITGRFVPQSSAEFADIIDDSKDVYSDEEPPYQNFCVEVSPGHALIKSGLGETILFGTEFGGIMDALNAIPDMFASSYINWLARKAPEIPNSAEMMKGPSVLGMLRECLDFLKSETSPTAEETAGHLSHSFLPQGVFMDTSLRIAPSVDWMQAHEECQCVKNSDLNNVELDEDARWLLVDFENSHFSLFGIDQEKFTIAPIWSV